MVPTALFPDCEPWDGPHAPQQMVCPEAGTFQFVTPIPGPVAFVQIVVASAVGPASARIILPDGEEFSVQLDAASPTVLEFEIDPAPDIRVAYEVVGPASSSAAGGSSVLVVSDVSILPS